MYGESLYGFYYFMEHSSTSLRLENKKNIKNLYKKMFHEKIWKKKLVKNTGRNDGFSYN